MCTWLSFRQLSSSCSFFTSLLLLVQFDAELLAELHLVLQLRLLFVKHLQLLLVMLCQKLPMRALRHAASLRRAACPWTRLDRLFHGILRIICNRLVVNSPFTLELCFGT